MPVVENTNFQVKTYPDYDTMQTDLDAMYNLGWKLQAFAYSGATVVAVYIRLVQVGL